MNFCRETFRTFFAVLILIAAMLVTTSCTESSDEVASSYIEVKSRTISSSGGNGEIAIYAEIGTEWTAQIVEGGEFTSFDISNSVLEISDSIRTAYSNRLYIYFSANSSGEFRYATLIFTFTGGETKEISFTQLTAEEEAKDPEYDWAELPEQVENDDYMYVTHFTEYNGKTIRNFSMCYDIKNYGARWVAYPFHQIYDAADVGRNENWAYDPKIPTAYQPNLSRSYSGSYDRGHQCASADRQSTTEMNIQTYYYSNMTPQYSTLNQQKWATIESVVRDQVCSDTLYVVTGADYSNIIGYTTDNSGKQCPIPGAYYKVIMRTKTGSTGKPVEDCTADELKAIGFWFEHEYYPALPDPISVAEIEAKTGFNFFPTIPSEVKKTYNATHWSF